MLGKERRPIFNGPIENGPIPGWTERERSGDLLWIVENMHVLWLAAQRAYASARRSHWKGRMTIPSLTGLEGWALVEPERQFLSSFAGIVQQYPHHLIQPYVRGSEWQWQHE